MTTAIDSRKLRMAMIGGGPGSCIGKIHRMGASLDGQIELVSGSFASSPEKSHEQGRALYLDPSRVYGDWREMLEREAKLPEANRPDIISIVTPNHLHFPQAKAALEAGFHVVLDKPMTMNMDEALQLRDVVKKRGRLFALTHTYASGVMVKLARDMIKRGMLGELRKIVVEYPQGWLYRLFEKEGQKQASWRTDPKLAGAGCVGDIGTHSANLSETVTGLGIVSVSADVGTVVKGRKLEDDFTAIARWENGVRGSIQASQVSTGEGNGLGIRVYGDKAGLEWRHEEMEFLTVMYQDRPWEKWARGAPYVAEISQAAARCTRSDPYHPEGYIEEFANIYFNFSHAVRAVESGRRPTELDLDFPNVEDGVRGMAFVQATLESARLNGAWVDVQRA